MLVSVVIPCYCSENIIGKVVAQTREELVRAGYGYEFILVNDGSADGTFEAIENLCAEDPQVVGINCAKNSGQHSAIMAGLRQAEGDLILLMDDDMQTHPSQCVKLLEAMGEGDDIVFATWPEHKQSWWRRMGSKFTTWSTRILTKRPKGVNSSNFAVFRKHVRDEVVRYRGPYIYIQILLFRATTNIKNVEVTHFAREEGKSGYNLKSLIRLWSTVLNFSMTPLRFGAVIGAPLGAVGIILAVIIAIMRIADPSMQTGWPSLMAAILTCSGLIIMFLGLIGEYIGRVFTTVNSAPQYVLRETIDHRDPSADTSTH